MPSGASRTNMTRNEKRKQSLYFPEKILDEIKAQAIRQDRSLSWIVQQAWRLAREKLKQIPSANEEREE